MPADVELRDCSCNRGSCRDSGGCASDPRDSDTIRSSGWFALRPAITRRVCRRAAGMRKGYFTRCATISRDSSSVASRGRGRPLPASKRLSSDRSAHACRSLASVIHESANHPSACNERERARRGALSNRGAHNQQAQTLRTSLQHRGCFSRLARAMRIATISTRHGSLIAAPFRESSRPGGGLSSGERRSRRCVGRGVTSRAG